ISRDDLLEGAELVASSPLVDELAGSVQYATGEISDGVNALLGPGRAIQNALVDVFIDAIEIGIDLPLLETLLSVDLGSPALDVNVDLSEVTDGLLTEPLVSDNGLVTIDLSSGVIGVDLAMLHQGNLNDLDRNTELLLPGEVDLIVQTASTL